MRFIIISGFLGSGKTTLILSAASQLAEQKNKKVVVLVNDFGAVGIDARVMHRHGLEVREIASGCICCSLAAGLLTTIKTMRDTFKPDLIILEPSGVADPGAVADLLQTHAGVSFQVLQTLVVVDGVRFSSILRALGDLVRRQLAAADMIVINKIDQVDAPAIQSVEKQIQELEPQKPILRASFKTGQDLDQVLEHLLNPAADSTGAMHPESPCQALEELNDESKP